MEYLASELEGNYWSGVGLAYIAEQLTCSTEKILGIFLGHLSGLSQKMLDLEVLRYCSRSKQLIKYVREHPQGHYLYHQC